MSSSQPVPRRLPRRIDHAARRLGRAGATVAALACTAALLTSAAPSTAVGGATAATGGTAAGQMPFSPTVSQPGRFNAVTDVPGIRVGQVHRRTAPFLTGTTVVYTPSMSVASVDQRGGAPATKETDLLSPVNSNPGVNAIQLGGSSMYGLSATDGIVRWLEDRGEGVGLGSTGVAPIVPAADIYDLGRGGDIKARTTPEWGWVAAKSTMGGPVRQGAYGGGTGARAGGLKGGVGTASVYLGDGIYVGAVVIVNAAGSTVDPRTCELLGVQFGLGDEFAGLRKPKSSECTTAIAAPTNDDLNTTIAVVATNASLEKAAAQRMSGNAHDGMARAIRPVHTLYDGDTVFAVATGQGTPLRVNNPADGRQLSAIFSAGADTLSRAIAKAMLSAETIGPARSYCDTYPSACTSFAKAAQWRTEGTSTVMTRRLFNDARRHLEVARLPWR